MIEAVAQAIIGMTLSVVMPLSVIFVGWRRGFGLGRTWFWLRVSLIVSDLWCMVSSDVMWVVALSALCFPILGLDHFFACRRLSRLREIAEDVAAGCDFGCVNSITFDNACFTAAGGSKS